MLSLNVRGLGDDKKRREIFRWLKRFHRGRDSITLLQETHSTCEKETLWEQDWGSKIYFSHGTSNARGVAILMPMKYNFDVCETWKDGEGRILGLKIQGDSISFNVVNTYAPTKDKATEQLRFLELLDTHFDFAEQPYIIGGDLNTYLNPVLDKEGGNIDHGSKYTDTLQHLMNEYNIIDIYRQLNPNTKHYTWRQNNPINLDNLDFITS